MTVINSKKAFSVMETMIAVSIVAILSTTAIIIYPKYKAKTEVAMAIKALEAYSLAAQNYYTENSFLPSTINAINSGTTAPTEINMTNTNDVLSLNYTFPNTASNSLKNQTISLELKLNNNIFSTSCKTSTVELNYLPANCINSIIQITTQTINTASQLLQLVIDSAKNYYTTRGSLPSLGSFPLPTNTLVGAFSATMMPYNNSITFYYTFHDPQMSTLYNKSLSYELQVNPDRTFTVRCSSYANAIDPKYLPPQCKQ